MALGARGKRRSSASTHGSESAASHCVPRLLLSDSLLALLSSLSFQQAVVFCNHRWEAAELAGRLAGAGYPAACLSGQRSQLERIDTLNALRELR